MKIQEVTIEGYQSHTNSTFRLSPGLTVITGPSDAGKTAIIRALYICVTVPVRINALWFLFQRVQKYRTTDTTQAITVQNGCISRLHLTVCSTQALAVRHI